MMTQAVVATLDQGYGWTKGMCQVGGTNVFRGAFPSLASEPRTCALLSSPTSGRLRISRSGWDCEYAATRFWKAGNIDYKRVPALKGVDLDAYRGKPREEVRVSAQAERSL